MDATLNRTYSIRQLTKEFSVTARTLRFYEDEGLIAPERRGQTRIYSLKDRARILLILRGRRLGFSLAEIRTYLALYNRDDNRPQLQHVRAKFVERIALYEKQKLDIDRIIAELQNGIGEVDSLLADAATTAASVAAA